LGRGALRRLAFGTALGVFLVNLLLEYWLMAAPSSAVIVPGLLDFHPASNNGVSFGLFGQESESRRYLLMAVVGLICAGVAVMAWQTADRLSAMAYGLILGGGVGNLFDRAVYGAVFDFLYLHLGAISLFVCNFSDIAISAGVALLLLASIAPNVSASKPTA
jgi:signal peptidase II